MWVYFCYYSNILLYSTTFLQVLALTPICSPLGLSSSFIYLVLKRDIKVRLQIGVQMIVDSLRGLTSSSTSSKGSLLLLEAHRSVFFRHEVVSQFTCMLYCVLLNDISPFAIFNNNSLCMFSRKAQLYVLYA